LQLGGGDDRLAQGEASIVGRHPAMRQELEPVALQALDRRCEQQPVLKASAAERNSVDLDLPFIGAADCAPLVAWEESQALTRRRRLHHQTGYCGPEVWLSTSA
jgi:hypothetical protein